jgi:hypothetical protein
VKLDEVAPRTIDAGLMSVYVTVTVCGLFVATDDATEIVALYVPAASAPVFGCTVKLSGALVPVGVIVSHPLGWPFV